MKKITFLLSDISVPGGIQRVVTNLVNNLLVEKPEYEITLLSIFKKGEEPFFCLDKNIKTVYLFNEKFDLRKGYFKVARAIKNYIKNNSIDIFINCGMGYVPLSVPATKNLKVISWEHSIISHGKKYGLTWFGRYLAVKKSHCIVVITKADFNNYVAEFKNIKQIHQIYNLVDTSSTSQEYNADSRKIISCGSLVPLKGYDMLIKVAKLVFSKYPQWSWSIYGDGILREELEKEILKNKLENNLILKGYVSNVEEFYKDYSIFVLTSKSEGFGMVLVEAQKAKLPIISFRSPGGPSEIIIDQKNGVLIDCYDVENMAEEICNLIESREKRIDFSKQANKNLDRFSGGEIINKWINLFDSL